MAKGQKERRPMAGIRTWHLASPLTVSAEMKRPVGAIHSLSVIQKDRNGHGSLVFRNTDRQLLEEELPSSRIVFLMERWMREEERT